MFTCVFTPQFQIPGNNTAYYRNERSGSLQFNLDPPQRQIIIDPSAMDTEGYGYGVICNAKKETFVFATTNSYYTLPTSRPLKGIKGDSVKGEMVKGESVKGESVKGESVKGKTVKGESVQGESVKDESVKGEMVKGESVQGESVKGESVKGKSASHRAVIWRDKSRSS